MISILFTFIIVRLLSTSSASYNYDQAYNPFQTNSTCCKASLIVWSISQKAHDNSHPPPPIASTIKPITFPSDNADNHNHNTSNPNRLALKISLNSSRDYTLLSLVTKYDYIVNASMLLNVKTI